MNHYEVLGASPLATQADLRKRYLELMLKLHPDKKTQQTQSSMLCSEDIQFHNVQLAWRTLSNPSRRFLYDIRTLGKSELYPDQDETFLIQLRMTEAVREVERLGPVNQKILTREMQRKGMIVTMALYGSYENLSNASKRPLETPMGLSKVVDVTIPVQCLVECGRIIISGGSTKSKSDLPGFYSPILPSENVPAGILIRYTFKDVLHQVFAADSESIFIPKKSQVVDIERAVLEEELGVRELGIAKRRAVEPQSQHKTILAPLKVASMISSFVMSAAASPYTQSLSPFIVCAAATFILSSAPNKFRLPLSLSALASPR